MKKTVSMILVCALLLGVVSILGSCQLFGTKKTGTEAAKLLLANERLDENTVGQKIDVGMAMMHNAMSEGASVDFGRKSSVIAASSGGKTWSDFPAHNDSMYRFESFFLNIDNYAINVASDIGHMKKNVGIVDKWVGDQMLRVYESRDVLVALSEEQDNIYYRYTDDNANNVYEMYFFGDFKDEGATGRGKMLLVPGERYEYYYDHSEGFKDYVIMENSRGYWMCTRFNYSTNERGNSVNFYPTIIKDGLAYTADVSMDTYEGNDGTPRVNAYSIVDAETGRELVGVGRSGSNLSFSIYLSGIKSGLVSVGADDYYSIEDGYYSTSRVNQLVTAKGSYTVAEDRGKEGEMVFNGGYVDYDSYLGKYNGKIHVIYNKEGATLSEGLKKLEAYLDDLGLTLYRGFDEIGSAINHAVLLGDSFGESFEWNGYTLSDITKVESAMEVLHSDIAKAEAEIDEVRSFEKADISLNLSFLPNFARLDAAFSGANTYSDGKINISEISGVVSDATLLESGEKYVLKVGLSLCDENGKPLSTNTVPLSGGNAAAVVYSGDAIALSVSGSFDVPKNLSHGNYAVVVYAATADAGIRVTEFLKIGSFSASENKLDSAAMDIDISVKDTNLYVKYSIKNTLTVNMTATKASYTYAEIEHIILLEVIKKGTPHEAASLEYADGGAVGKGDSLGKGRYRLMCYLPTADGMAESYVYLNLE